MLGYTHFCNRERRFEHLFVIQFKSNLIHYFKESNTNAQSSRNQAPLRTILSPAYPQH